MVALDCSDASGAFDRVCEARLTDKLRRLGLHPQFVGILLNWLAPRTTVVVVDDQCSAKRTLETSVYQKGCLVLHC